MKKIKSVASQFTNTQKPEKEYVIRLESTAGALVARYFKVVPSSQVENETIEEGLDGMARSITAMEIQETVALSATAALL